MAKVKSMPAFLTPKSGSSKPAARRPERALPRYALGPDATMTSETPFLQAAKKGGKIRRK